MRAVRWALFAWVFITGTLLVAALANAGTKPQVKLLVTPRVAMAPIGGGVEVQGSVVITNAGEQFACPHITWSLWTLDGEQMRIEKVRTSTQFTDCEPGEEPQERKRVMYTLGRGAWEVEVKVTGRDKKALSDSRTVHIQ